MIDISFGGGILTGSRRTGRPRILCNDDTAFIDQQLRIILLKHEITQRVYITDTHQSLRSDRTRPEEKCRKPGNHFRSRIGADITDQRFIRGDHTAVYHFPQLHSGDIMPFITSGIECMVIPAFLHIRGNTVGKLAKLNIRIIRSKGFYHITARNGENKITAALYQFFQPFFRLVALYIRQAFQLNTSLEFSFKHQTGLHKVIGAERQLVIFGKETDNDDIADLFFIPEMVNKTGSQQHQQTDDERRQIIFFHAAPPSSFFTSGVVPREG